jgi:hypothetical protein
MLITTGDSGRHKALSDEHPGTERLQR